MSDPDRYDEFPADNEAPPPRYYLWWNNKRWEPGVVGHQPLIGREPADQVYAHVPEGHTVVVLSPEDRKQATDLLANRAWQLTATDKLLLDRLAGGG